MDAKKLVVGLVTAVTLTLFTAAAYAQQLTAPQEDDTAQASYAHQEKHGGTHEHHGHHGRA